MYYICLYHIKNCSCCTGDKLENCPSYCFALCPIGRSCYSNKYKGKTGSIIQGIECTHKSQRQRWTIPYVFPIRVIVDVVLITGHNVSVIYGTTLPVIADSVIYPCPGTKLTLLCQKHFPICLNLSWSILVVIVYRRYTVERS